VLLSPTELSSNMVTSSEGESVGEREKVGVKEVDGATLGNKRVGSVVGEVVGAGIVGALVGDWVGTGASAVCVGLAVGESVGVGVVGALVGDTVSSAVSSKVRTCPVQFMLFRGLSPQLKSRTPSQI
jgi:hypothetical protein